MPNVILQSSDEINLTLDENVARMSSTVMIMLQDLGATNLSGGEVKIVLPHVRGDVLKIIFDWCLHHHGETKDDKPLCHSDIPDWDKEFFKVNESLLMDLILASNYLDIETLLEYAQHTIAQVIEDKTPEEIRNIFKIKNDLTPEEMERIQKENEWITSC